MKLDFRRPDSLLLALLGVLALGGIAPDSPGQSLTPAFPGAEGFGAHTRGGRGGKVLIVNTLGDQTDGVCDTTHCSLREALQTQGPRTITFAVGGTITVTSQIHVSEPFVTIAGQSAPGDGILLRISPTSILGPLKISTHDVILRHLRFRPGNGARAGEGNSNIDALTIASASSNEEGGNTANQVYNIVVDHCSFSWATDENLNLFFDAHDITLQWNIIAEGLHCVPGNATCHSKGLLVGSDGSHSISLHHNLLAHNVGRNPLLTTTGIVDVVNNVVHAPVGVAIATSTQYGVFDVNLIGNYVQAGEGANSIHGLWVLGNGTSVYLENNIGPQKQSLSDPEYLFVRPDNNGRSYIIDTWHEAPAVTTTSPFQALEDVLAGAGATLPSRDPVDARVVNEVRQHIYRVINDPAEVGGWPFLDSGAPPIDSDHDGMADAWEQTHFGSVDRGSPVNSSQDFDGDGYTDLEEYLNGTNPASTRPSAPRNLTLIP